ncbi:MAG: aromatic amino acid hydroxylase [Bacteroidales bacterium]|nr:aromatic amino acid hydroxylase [Bacteroidales bacterium]
MHINNQCAMELNEILVKLPKHLLNLVIDQPYNEYTPQDHAVWRYVMRQNVRYLPKVAHHSYLEGLKKTGVSIESIPHMYGMNRILKEIGWAAVAVDGFIPPSAFMEFQAYNVLVIAADIRPVDQIEYTPAPDIIHEAAGHAPIIADIEYADYLRLFGEIGSRAFSSALDYEVYNAVRHLSILKADPYSTTEEIKIAEHELEILDRKNTTLSEMSLIRNLHWWTVEYGLIGDLKNPKIYGAGLLSSIGESYSSFQPNVKKLPYTVDAANVTFDITTRQPQLFVTPDFIHLNEVLDNFACQMAVRRGGLYALKQAIGSGNTATVVYSSGLQVSGTFNYVIASNDKPAYIKTTGPTSLAFKNKQLPGHGKDYHAEGFGSPAGLLVNQNKPLEIFSDSDLSNIGLEEGKPGTLEFYSGVRVEGKLRGKTRKDGRLLLLTFDNCRVTFRDQVLFEPAWGVFDMAVGEKIISAYTGPADPDAFGYSFIPPDEKTHKIVHNEKAKILHQLYQQVREQRENGREEADLDKIFKVVINEYPEEWLLPMEIQELTGTGNDLGDRIRQYLNDKKERNPALKNLIENGLLLIKKPLEENAMKL